MNSRRTLIFVGALATALVGATVQTTTADAAQVVADRAMKTVAQGPAVELINAEKQSDGTKSAKTSGGKIILPPSSEESVGVTSSTGASFEVKLPSSKNVEGKSVSDSTVVYPSASTDGSVAVQSTTTGFRTVVTIDGPSSPSVYEYKISQASGGWMEIGDDGAVQIYDADGNPIGGFGAPWAIDADGKSLPTSYAVNGDVLTQRIQHEQAVYPVAADPQFTWGWITGTLYFDRSETNTMTTSAGIGAILGGVCASSLVTGPFAIAICAGAGAHSGVISIMANHYYNTNRCLKLKIPTFEPGSVRLGDRNCR